MNKFDKTISVSLGMSAIPLLLMGLVLLLTKHGNVWTIPFALGLVCTMGMLHWDNRAQRRATKEIEERIKKERHGWERHGGEFLD